MSVVSSVEAVLRRRAVLAALVAGVVADCALAASPAGGCWFGEFVGEPERSHVGGVWIDHLEGWDRVAYQSFVDPGDRGDRGSATYARAYSPTRCPVTTRYLALDSIATTNRPPMLILPAIAILDAGSIPALADDLLPAGRTKDPG